MSARRIHDLPLPRWLAGIGLALLLSAPAGAQVPRISDVTYAVAGITSDSRLIRGRLTLPANLDRAVPAVILLHGGTGIDNRGAFHAEALQAAGIATFEIEMFRRGNRPPRHSDAIPAVVGAISFLAAQPGIDPRRIGTMGFSWGGTLSLMMASRRYGENLPTPDGILAGHVSFYPGCYYFQPDPTGRMRPISLGALTAAPVLILTGDKDDYDRPESCPQLRSGFTATERDRLTVHVFPGATHNWDGNQPASFQDSAANLGRGGTVTITPNPAVADQSRRMSVDFFRKVFNLGN